jgi:dienelactone hydrolase
MRSTDSQSVIWTSSASFRADARGVVDLNRAAAASRGSYSGVWGMGLLASMTPLGGSPVGAYFWNGSRPLGFLISARTATGHVATASVSRRLETHSIVPQTISLTSEGFSGVFFAPPRSSPSPAVLLFGGSEGGLYGTYLLGAQLAAHGYPALVIAYFKAPELPQTLERIPLEYFAKALGWLRQQPHVDPERLAVLGVSRGSEAALLLGVHYPSLVHAVIASVPSNVSLCGIAAVPTCAGPAWMLGGKALPYTREYDTPHPTDDPAAVIPVEKIRGPVFLACAEKDAVWTSCAYARAIRARLDAHHDPHLHVLEVARGADHYAGSLLPYEPSEQVPGTAVAAQANERGREMLWPGFLRFLATLRR